MMTDLRFRRGDSYIRRGSKGGHARHTGHAITVTEVEPMGDEHDRVQVECDCGGRWAFVHWWRRRA